LFSLIQPSHHFWQHDTGFGNLFEPVSASTPPLMTAA